MEQCQNCKCKTTLLISFGSFYSASIKSVVENKLFLKEDEVEDNREQESVNIWSFLATKLSGNIVSNNFETSSDELGHVQNLPAIKIHPRSKSTRSKSTQ